MSVAKKHFFAFFILLLLGFAQISAFLFFSSPTLADSSLIESQEGMKEIRYAFGWEEKSDIRIIIVNIIRIILGLLGVIFLSLMLFAGFRYMTSGGNEDQAKEATKQIKNAVIGLAIIMTSWVITTSIFRYLVRAVNNNVQIWD